MTTEVKFRTLAKQDATLQTFFGDESNGTFRMFDTQLQPNYLKVGNTCARVLRVSTVRQYAHRTATHQGQQNLALVRLQVDVLDYDSERARAAAAAIVDWLSRVSFAENAQFASPPTSPKAYPNQVLNERGGLEPRTQPPAWVQILDIRVMSLEE